jgi:hypothetical protein
MYLGGGEDSFMICNTDGLISFISLVSAYHDISNSTERQRRSAVFNCAEETGFKSDVTWSQCIYRTCDQQYSRAKRSQVALTEDESDRKKAEYARTCFVGPGNSQPQAISILLLSRVHSPDVRKDQVQNRILYTTLALTDYLICQQGHNRNENCYSKFRKKNTQAG